MARKKRLRKSPSHILIQGTTIHFRIAVPKNLVNLLDLREITKTLGTNNMAKGRALAAVLAVAVKKLFADLRNHTLVIENPDMFHSELSTFFDEIIDRFSNVDASSIDISAPPLTKKVFMSIASNPTNQRDNRDSLPTEVVETRPTSNKREIYLDKAWGKICFESTNSQKWSKTTAVEHRGTFKIFFRFAGNRLISTIDCELIEAFVDFISFHYPKRRYLSPYRNLTFEDLKKIRIPQEYLVKQKTRENYYRFLILLLNWADRRGYNVRKDTIALLKNLISIRQKSARPRFSEEDLRKIFFSKAYTKDKFDREERFWVPIIAYYTGARLEEICQLETDDIDFIGEIPCMKITGEQSKKIKNQYSWRMIPLHPDLAYNMHFLGFVEKKRIENTERLFPNLYRNKKDILSWSVSKWFTQFRRNLGIGVEEGDNKCFHSFRHTFCDIGKKQEIGYTLLYEYVGHSGINSNLTLGFYGKIFSPRDLYNGIIKKMVFPVDISHLKNSKFIRDCEKYTPQRDET